MRTVVRSCAVAVVVVATLAGCPSDDAPTAEVAVHPATSLLTEPVRITASRLEPGERVTLELSATDVGGAAWSAAATFRAGDDGTVDVAAQSSESGDYEGLVPMGLVLSMAPETSDPDGFEWPTTAPAEFRVTATVDGDIVGSTTFERRMADPGVSGRRVDPAAGFVGRFWRPAVAGDRPRPALLVFGGSEGGLSMSLPAAAFASAGYPTLQVAYFDAPGLPKALSNVRLEYFAGALRWLAARPGVDPSRMYVLGVSRGSEAAQLLGIHFPDLVYGVVAGVPSNVSFGAYPNRFGPAWTLRGKPIPFTSQLNEPYPSDNPRAVIPVEWIQGPIFLDCGGFDMTWDSCDYARAMMTRLERHGYEYPHVLARYPAAEHTVGVFVPYQPMTDTHIDTKIALADVWPKLLEFLDSTSGH
jgi:dienelactone hydrolase